MFNAATFIQNLTYVCFGIILTQFYVNYSRQKHQIDVLYVLYVICLKHIKKEQKKLILEHIQNISSQDIFKQNVSNQNISNF